MKDFMMAALPFVVIGVCLAVFFANSSRKKGKTYMTEGLCFGMALGIALSGPFEGSLSIGLSLGMLVGVIVGMQIRKED